MEPRIINYTSHDITILNDDNSVKENFPTIRKNARIHTRTTTIGYIRGIPITKIKSKSVKDNPPPEYNTCYVVSHTFKRMFPERLDLLCPQGKVYDKYGRVIGCRSLTSIIDDEFEEDYLQAA